MGLLGIISAGQEDHEKMTLYAQQVRGGSGQVSPGFGRGWQSLHMPDSQYDRQYTPYTSAINI